MRPSAVLDLLFVPQGGGGGALVAAWRDAGVLDARGGPGPHADRLGVGFARVWVDRPGRLTLFANRQGGFAVRCPATGAPVASAFSAAWEAVRRREPPPDAVPELPCPACGAVHPLDRLDVRPAVAFGTEALVIADATGPALSPEAEEAVAAALGPVVRVLRRG